MCENKEVYLKDISDLHVSLLYWIWAVVMEAPQSLPSTQTTRNIHYCQGSTVAYAGARGRAAQKHANHPQPMAKKRQVQGHHCQGQVGEFFEDWEKHWKPCCFHFLRNQQYYKQKHVESGHRQAIQQGFIVCLLSKKIPPKWENWIILQKDHIKRNLWGTWGGDVHADIELGSFSGVYEVYMPSLLGTLSC